MTNGAYDRGGFGPKLSPYLPEAVPWTGEAKANQQYKQAWIDGSSTVVDSAWDNIGETQ